jgi:Flp pilus assembly pilin Flp
MRGLLQDQSGATTIEYGLILSLVVIVAFLAVQLFGASVKGLFQSAIDIWP